MPERAFRLLRIHFTSLGVTCSVDHITGILLQCTIIQLQLATDRKHLPDRPHASAYPHPSAWRQLEARHLRPSLTQPHRIEDKPSGPQSRYPLEANAKFGSTAQHSSTYVRTRGAISNYGPPWPHYCYSNLGLEAIASTLLGVIGRCRPGVCAILCDMQVMLETCSPPSGSLCNASETLGK